MYEYKFVRTEMGLLQNSKKVQASLDDLEKIIQEQAAKGWRLIQVFMPNHNSFGGYHCEIIFEKTILKKGAIHQELKNRNLIIC